MEVAVNFSRFAGQSLNQGGKLGGVSLFLAMNIFRFGTCFFQIISIAGKY